MSRPLAAHEARVHQPSKYVTYAYIYICLVLLTSRAVNNYLCVSCKCLPQRPWGERHTHKHKPTHIHTNSGMEDVQTLYFLLRCFLVFNSSFRLSHCATNTLCAVEKHDQEASRSNCRAALFRSVSLQTE